MGLFRIFRIAAIAALAIGFAGMTTANARPIGTPHNTPPNAYALEMSITRNGKILAAPRMTVLPDKAAQMRLDSPDARDGNLRIQVLATPAARTANGRSTVDIQAIVMEQVSGAWVVTGEPSLRTAEGKVASVAVDSGAGSLEVQFRVQSTHEPRAQAQRPIRARH